MTHGARALSGLLAALSVPAASFADAESPLSLRARFEENLGQADDRYRFLGRFAGGWLGLTEQGAELLVGTAGGPRAMTLRLVNAAGAQVEGEEPLPGTTSYLTGCVEEHVTGVRGYACVRYRQLLPGLDLVVRTSGGAVEYDVVADPGCASQGIEVAVDGADALFVDGDGALASRVGDAVARQLPPVVFQDGPEGRVAVTSRWVLTGPSAARVLLGDHDRALPTTVDPILEWSTFLGGDGQDSVTAVATGPGGDIYVGGTTSSLTFPHAGPPQPANAGSSDAFVAHLDPAGNLVHATFLGGSGHDEALAIAVDAGGSPVIVGSTTSPDFPVVAAFQPGYRGLTDAFVARLTPDGTAVVYATYLGGGGDDCANGIAVDFAGTAHVVGTTSSADLPVVQAFQPVKAGGADAFVARIGATGFHGMSSYLGGSGDDRAAAVTTDAAGNVWIAGSTASDDLPVRFPFQPQRAGESDAFVARVDLAGTLGFASYLGGTDADGAAAITQIPGGGVALAGWSGSWDFPVYGTSEPWNHGNEDVFVTKVSPAGTVLLSTLIGGQFNESASAVGALPSGDVVVAGGTASPDFPVVGPVQRAYAGGYGDVFVAQLSGSDGAVLDSTLVGGSASDGAHALAIDPAGRTIVVGSTSSEDLPVKAAYLSTTDGQDGFVLSLLPGGADPVAQFVKGCCEPGVDFLDNSVGPITGRTWSFGDGATSSAPNPVHYYPGPGSYNVSLTVTGPGGTDTATKPDLVQIVEAAFDAFPPSGPAPLTVAFVNRTLGPADSFSWRFDDGDYSDERDPVHTFVEPGEYRVGMTASSRGSYDSASITIEVGDAIAEFRADPRIPTTSTTVQFTDLSTGTPLAWAWEFGDGTTSTLGNPTHRYLKEGTYGVRLTVTSASGTSEEWKQSYIRVQDVRPPVIAAGPGPDPAAAPVVVAFDVLSQPLPVSFQPYATPGYGVTVGTARLSGLMYDAYLTGPGPSPVYGPHVRAFNAAAVPLPKVSFYAYGTLRYGVTAIGARILATAPDDILTGAGPGTVFAPHVRGFSYDGVATRPIAGLSFFAYDLPSYGVNASRGDFEDRGGLEDIVTGPGPGMAYLPLVRVFRFDGVAAPLPGGTFFGLPTPRWGAHVDAGDTYFDDDAEILVGGGPGPDVTTAVRSYTFEPPILVFDEECLPFLSYYGSEPRGGDDAGGDPEGIYVGRGADPSATGDIRICRGSEFGVTAFATRYGVHVATGNMAN